MIIRGTKAERLGRMLSGSLGDAISVSDGACACSDDSVADDTSC